MPPTSILSLSSSAPLAFSGRVKLGALISTQSSAQKTSPVLPLFFLLRKKVSSLPCPSPMPPLLSGWRKTFLSAGPPPRLLFHLYFISFTEKQANRISLTFLFPFRSSQLPPIPLKCAPTFPIMETLFLGTVCTLPCAFDISMLRQRHKCTTRTLNMKQAQRATTKKETHEARHPQIHSLAKTCTHTDTCDIGCRR